MKIGKTPAEIVAFRQWQRGLMDRCRREAESVLEEPEELAVWDRILTTFREAAWIETLHQFPDGRPYCEQDPLDLEYWMLALGALREASLHGRNDGAVRDPAAGNGDG